MEWRDWPAAASLLGQTLAPRQVLASRHTIPRGGREPTVIAARSISMSVQAGDPDDVSRIDQVFNPDSSAVSLLLATASDL
jgi:hypothetical protein